MRRKLILMLGTVLTAACLITGTFSGVRFPVQADTTKSYQDEIDKAKENKKKLEEERKELQKKVEKLKQDKEDMNAYIEQMDAQYLELLDDIDALETDIVDSEEELAKTQEDLEKVKAQEAEQYDIMKRRVRYMYENGETSFMDILLGSGTLEEMFNEMEYRRAITKYDNELPERYNATKLRVEETERLLIAQLDEQNALKETLEYDLAAVEDLITAKAAELEKLAASIGVDEEMLDMYWDEIINAGADIKELEKKEAARIAEEERKRKEEEERLRREEEERRKQQQINEELKWNSDLENMPGLFLLREESLRILVTVMRRLQGLPRSIRGLILVPDLPSSKRQVVAALSGRVKEAGYSASSGNYIVLDHGNGLTTKYLHAAKLYVRVNQVVERGEVIMLAGSTGYSSGPHLHFGISVNGVSLDPLKYIKYKK